MIAEILSTGDEILTGSIVDSNSAYIAEKLALNGVNVVRHTCVGDDRSALVSVLKEIGVRADLAVITGGLGPTADDLTAETAAMAAGVELVYSEIADRSIDDFFKNHGRLRRDSDKKQAMLPEGAECIVNPVGTAPGFMVKVGKCHVFCVPGVPAEMQRMLSDSVLPAIQKLLGNDRAVLLTRTISVFGMSEAAVGEHLLELEEKFPGIKLGLCAEFPEIKVKLYVRSEVENNPHKIVGEASDWVLGKIGKHVFSKTGGSMASEVGRLLGETNSTLSVAESCTGGLISHMLTNVPGSSSYFLFSAITYSNQAKMDVLGVSSKSLEKFGAVSEDIAKEMAEGARRVSGSLYGLSTSGIAGPDGGTDEKPVGTICIGVAGPDFLKGFRYNLSFGSRSRNKTIFAMAALELLRRELNPNFIK
ncbi:MAG: competence/damage-inducible protein A [Deltaproteobacteria bacterium]|nr:competence/damage-inducible protein A [Deltaproteobacteria bacterium]